MNREAWLHAVADKLAGSFKQHGYPIPAKVRLACGFPSTRGIAARNRASGECWSDALSADGHHEILISPVIADGMKVTATLAHELIHAAVGVQHGHKGPFRKLALAIGLEGKMPSTTAGEAFKRLLQPILDEVGPYSHAELSVASDRRKKQTTRLIKCQCASCGYVARVARSWLVTSGAPHCPEHGEMEAILIDGEIPPAGRDDNPRAAVSAHSVKE
jgi:hypothetical protein